VSVSVTLSAARAWLQVPATSLSDAQLQQVLDAETYAQARACRVDSMYPQPNLEQALLRRVGRSVAARGVPLGLLGDAEFGPTRLPAFDAEIERLEGPDRVVVFG